MSHGVGSLWKIAFDERVKIHDLVLEGIDAALRARVCVGREPQGREEVVEAGWDGEVCGWGLVTQTMTVTGVRGAASAMSVR
jgi:hypothetical protein